MFYIIYYFFKKTNPVLNIPIRILKKSILFFSHELFAIHSGTKFDVGRYEIFFFDKFIFKNNLQLYKAICSCLESLLDDKALTERTKIYDFNNDDDNDEKLKQKYEKKNS